MRILVTAMLLVAVGFGGYVAGAGGFGALTTSLAAQGECQTFPETGKQVCGRFLAYWRANGGLAQQGLPLSDEFDERSDVNGQTYKVQYFERAVFEYHPENQAPFDVLLSLLGRETFLRKYPAGLPSGEIPAQAGQVVVLVGGKEGTTFQVTIEGVEERAQLPEGYGGKTPTSAQGKYVVLLASDTNLGRESDSINSSRVRLKDSQGRLFDPAEIAIQRGGERAYSRVYYGETAQPGISKKIVMVFDVAPDATGFSVVSRPR